MWLRACKKASLHIHPAWYYQDSTEHSRAGRQAYQKSSQRLAVTSFANVGSFKVVHHFFASVIRICTSGSFIEFVSGCEITPWIYFSCSLPSSWSHKLLQRSRKPLTHVKVNKTKYLSNPGPDFRVSHWYCWLVLDSNTEHTEWQADTETIHCLPSMKSL